MKKFNVIKKNRKYFAATTNGYKCKILIDENSQDLEIGEHELEVEDLSVRSKYGTDLIFKLTATAEEQEAGICTLRHFMYNKNLREACLELGGKWDGEEKAWIFSGLVEDKVEELDDVYNSPLVNCEITFPNGGEAYTESCFLFGYMIAKASGRDSGAKQGDGVSLIEGGFDSGGSMKNWKTIVEADTVIRMQLPEKLLPEHIINDKGLAVFEV